MSLYDIYQINLTKAQVEIINSSRGNLPEFYKEYLDTTFKPTKKAIMQAGHQYKLVAQIEADGLEDVFRVGNIGPETNIRRLDAMHSLSVGDVIVCCVKKEIYYVDSFGFVQIPEFKEYV